MRVLLYGQRIEVEDIEIISRLLHDFSAKAVKVYIDVKLYSQLLEKNILVAQYEVIHDHKELVKEKIDFVITLGGDGTILHAATLVKNAEIPILGINLGRLGFLASTEKHKVGEAIDALVNGHYIIDGRTMIEVTSNLSIFGENNFALNDFTVHKRDNSAMITVHCYINGEYLNAIWADGLIISTPTGSTGYSLSCGGPIVFPGSGNFIITPIAPHNLTMRPIVFSDEKEITLTLEGRTDSFLCTLDSRHEIISAEHRITVKKCKSKFCLVQLEGNSFIHTVSEKLLWGLDKRNK